MLIPDWLVKNARQFPDKTALVDLHSGRRVSYSALNERASRFAEYMRDRWHVQAGDRIAVLAHSSTDYVEMLYGCAKLGAVMICLNWRLAVEELKGVLEDCKPAALVWGEEFDSAGLALSEAFELQGRMVTGAPRQGIAGYEAALAEMSGATIQMPWRREDEVWYMLYTAGTTGKPKGVLQTWGMAHVNAVNNIVHAELTRRDVMLSVLPYFHTGGLNLYMNPMLMLGGTTLIMRQFDVEQTMNLLENEATVFFGVPAIYLFLSQHPRFGSADFSRVRSWAAGGAP
ncbi:MAG TPA: AMP-binding protein, partial [Rhodocyclaceae bacterium]|nr:AMP-binding protein [Rhodocyclaceae bacterium]